MKKYRTSDLIAGCLVAVSLVLLLLGGTWRYPMTRTESLAGSLEKKLDRRMALLDTYVDKALSQSPDEWLDLGRLPEDMVVYRYVNDTLQSWCNRFPLLNDALHSGAYYGAVINSRASVRSPLSEVGHEVSFCNLGPGWYLVKAVDTLSVRIVAGLELVNDDDNYSIRPLSFSEGEEVRVGGKPILKLVCEAPGTPLPFNSRLLFLALGLLAAAGFFYLSGKPVLGRFWAVAAPVLPIMLVLVLLGRRLGNDIALFSPVVYADDGIFYSLGAHANYLTAIVLLVGWLFIVRRDIYRKLQSRRALYAWGLFVLAAAAGVLIYSVAALRSIVLNSNISLEIYKPEDFSAVSAVVYVAYILLLACVLMLVQMLQPVLRRCFGIRFSAFSRLNAILFSFAGAALFVWMTASLGLKKEQASLEVWANRLAVSRDISLEMRIRSVEDRIAEDPIIASLSTLPNGGSSIIGRLEESYFARIMQKYDVTVSLNPEDFTGMDRLEPITPDSRFSLADTGSGFVKYVGVFMYNVRGYGISRVLIVIEQKSDWKYSGYASIIGPSLPGEVMIPPKYSFARYDSDKLLTFKGMFAYSVKMPHRWETPSDGRVQSGGWLHFIYGVAPDETVVISRRSIRALNYFVAVIFLALVSFLFFSLFAVRRRSRRAFGQSYFQTRIRLVVLVSLTASLVTMAIVSVVFVINRNEANRNALMSEKINSIQASLSARYRTAVKGSEIRNSEMLRMLEDVASDNNSDITLYSPSGMVMLSTSPTIFYQMHMDPRIDENAYQSIARNTSRYFIQKEKIAGRVFYNMYAPLLSEDGTLIAIISSPYTDESYDFESYVVSHSLMIVSLFIFLLLSAMFMASRVLELMFKPLVEMGSKMDAAGTGDLEYIHYDSRDEITGLVNAYNRMVRELGESSRKLAQAERDKAWSGMARQVAHEIKNPLTPMKLQIQRLIRLKNKGDGSWQDKFDEISRILLDHIDMLTETANEFSTFAKLYTQEPDEIDLSSLLQEEISIFDNRDDMRFEFIGLGDVKIMGPKPQLTRVFVNLLNNSVQALTETGSRDGVVRVSLRNSITEGFYDIVFEDSGPGVDEVNVDKLFTPNFTTKNGGSGLGLAISRSVLERCGATISYSRSFSLGGACFTILYPRG